ASAWEQRADSLAASLIKTRRANEASDGVLAVAANEDLTYSKAEVEAVGELEPATKILLGAKVTEKVIRDELMTAPYRVILLSTHGEVNEKKPYFSGLRLNKEPSGMNIPENNGFLTVEEIQDFVLEGTDLVYLSSCESASGRLYRGEGIVGMQRAFLIAGANSVIANLWQVDDKASKNLTIEFFKKWFSGTYTKAEALRQAQLSQIDQLRKSSLFKKHPHPYFWAAVTLTGNPK
ncbi:MAG: CHAT domain-containing protein, partial [bacterium]